MRGVGVGLIVFGLIGTGAGVFAAFLPENSGAAWKRWGGAIVTPLAILIALVGVVLVVLPEFFSA